MCLGVPARVIEITNGTARVVIGDVEYDANISLLDHVFPGDYVILHAGFAIETIDPEEAAETIRLVREIEQQGEKDV
jgi:hydrogenase expression/formation protein HypC